MSELQYPVGMATFSELIEDADTRRLEYEIEAWNGGFPASAPTA